MIFYRDSDGAEHHLGLHAAADIAFENAALARTIPEYIGQRHTPGDYWSATTGSLISYESWLESKWMTLLDFDLDITAYSSQPLTFHGVDAAGSWSHTPDIFARRRDGSVLLLDVKNPRTAGHLDVLTQARRTRATCQKLGWDYGVFTDIDRQLWATVSWLAGYRRDPHAGQNYISQMMALAHVPVPFADLLLFAEAPELARPVLFHLCWRQEIVFDLTRPLRDSTLVHARRPDESAYHVCADQPRQPSPDRARSTPDLTIPRSTAMSSTQTLTLDKWIFFDDDEHQIVGFVGTAVRLRSRTGSMQVITTAALLDPAAGLEVLPSGRPAAPEQDPEPSQRSTVLQGWDEGAIWDELDDADRDAATELERHLLEAMTGYRSGSAEDPQPGEPRPQYDPRLSVEARMVAKADELKYSRRRMYQLRKDYRATGLMGLIDKRKLKGRNPLARLDPRIVVAIREQAIAEESESTGTLNRFRRRVQNRLDLAHGRSTVVLPSVSTFNRAVHLLLGGRYTFGLASTRRTAANKPARSYAHVTAHRPGEIVMLDTSWLDVVAYDPIADDTIPCEITVALDLYSRSLLAWRITPLGTKGIDIGLLVADAMTPEPMRAGWSEALRYNMLQIPEQRMLSIDERLAAAASRPVVYPETLLIDHGKPYKSDVMRRTCNRLGISFPSARKGKPTDKPEVEAVFHTIRNQFSEHVAGYKGPDVARRGADPQAQARWTIPELEEFFAEYVVAVYQRRWHDGLTVPGYPRERLSPNDAYGYGVGLAGYVVCPRDPTLYFQLLPIARRKISDVGVQIGHLVYADPKEHAPDDDPDRPRLSHYRNTTSPYADGSWPIRYDPRNLLHAYFHDPFDDRWVLLRWTHALDEHQPFTDNTLREVTKLVAGRDQRRADQAEIAAALIDLQNRTDAPETWTTTDRRRAARDADRARAAARDHHRAVLEASDTADQHRVPALRVVSAPVLDDRGTDLLDPDHDEDPDLGSLPDVTPAPTWRSLHQRQGQQH